MRTLRVCAVAALLAASVGPTAFADYKGSWRYEGSELAFEQVGLASWYGKEFAGRRTASGVIYNEWGLTAAHRDLPLGAEVTVTNLENGKSIIVVVDDRGPYIKGRVIDLSRGAARELGMVAQGVARVRIEATEEQLALANAGDNGQ